MVEFIVRDRKQRDQIEESEVGFYTVSDYHKVGSCLLDSLVDLLINEKDLNIPKGL